jgi:hypothetical protein
MQLCSLRIQACDRCCTTAAARAQLVCCARTCSVLHALRGTAYQGIPSMCTTHFYFAFVHAHCAAQCRHSCAPMQCRLACFCVVFELVGVFSACRVLVPKGICSCTWLLMYIGAAVCIPFLLILLSSCMLCFLLALATARIEHNSAPVGFFAVAVLLFCCPVYSVCSARDHHFTCQGSIQPVTAAHMVDIRLCASCLAFDMHQLHSACMRLCPSLRGPPLL